MRIGDEMKGGIMLRGFKFGILVSLAAAGCMTAGEKTNCEDPQISTIHDTIYTSPPVPGAPEIGNLTQREYPADFNLNLVYLDWDTVRAAIGYNVYKANAADGPYQLVSTGDIGEGYGSSWRTGIGGLNAGLVFFKVAAVNNDGEEGPMSPHRAILYNGP